MPQPTRGDDIEWYIKTAQSIEEIKAAYDYARSRGYESHGDADKYYGMSANMENRLMYLYLHSNGYLGWDSRPYQDRYGDWNYEGKQRYYLRGGGLGNNNLSGKL